MATWIEDYLVVNEFSRPGLKLLGVKGIVMHWTADPGATDENEVNFFNSSQGGGGRYASAHFFVDRDSARLDIPLNEVAYHANEKPCKIPALQASAPYYAGGGANLTAIGVEMCVEKDGTIHDDTVNRVAEVVVQLCKQFNLDPLKDIYRHYDITGKNCPGPWVADEQKFIDFKNKVKSLLVPVAPEKVVASSKPVIEYVYLPATADSWRVYPINKVAVKGNEIGFLNPKKFGGLKYQILANPQQDVYTIYSGDFGKVNIYAASGTGAVIKTFN